MKIKKEIEKIEKKCKKIFFKILNKTSYLEFCKLPSENIMNIVSEDYDRRFHIMSDIKFKEVKRNIIISTLNNLGYKRENNEWTEAAAIAFIHQVLNLYQNSYCISEDIMTEREQEISTQFNVPVNRLKTQVALFLNNLEKGKDCFHLTNFFEYADLIKWRYRDPEKLQRLIENNQIPQKHLIILKSLDKIQ